MTARGFCVCHRTTDRRELLPAPGAAWHYLCDKPVLPPAPAGDDQCYCMGGVGPHPYHGTPRAADDPPEYVPGDGEAQRIAEVYADAKAELDRGL